MAANIPLITPVILEFRQHWETNIRRLKYAVDSQAGDHARLSTVYQQGLQFLQVTDTVRHLLPDTEVELADRAINNLLEDVEDAATRPDVSIASYIRPMQLLSTGGRPFIDIDAHFLETAISLSNVQRTAEALGVSRWTVRRRLIRLGLVEKEGPVITRDIGPDGEETIRYHQPQLESCTWTRDELEGQVRRALTIFPDFGRPMLLAYFREEQGVRIPEERMEAALRQIVPERMFGQRALDERRTYSVAGPNALWHIDAQLGLVRWGYVIHGIVDGYSRCMTGIRVNDNNRKASFFNLFQEAREESGTPSRVRGDHGVENLDIAEWMIHYRGDRRGSFIWGKSVHNIRIERLWVDITNGFGRKWKRFFKRLEIHVGLVVIDPGHIWLLHYLFLDDLNTDAQQWRRIWNCHKMILPDGQRKQSPDELWFFGSVQNGVRGVNDAIWEYEHEWSANTEEFYGVDWQDLQNDALVDHHMAQPSGVPVRESGMNRTMSEVRVDPTSCPLTPAQILSLEAGLEGHFESNDMLDRAERWARGLSLYNDLLQGIL